MLDKAAQIIDCSDVNLPRCGEGTDGGIESILGIVFLAAGAVSVLFILIGAARFAAATGDPGRLKQARETIIYAIVGLIVSISAFSIVTFVIGNT